MPRGNFLTLIRPGLLASPPAGDDTSNPTSTTRRRMEGDEGAAIFGLFALTLSGLVAVTISVWMLALFRRKFNVTSPRCKFFANTAYTVYLIHPLVVVPLTMLWVTILRNVFDIDVLFLKDVSQGHRSATDVGSDGLVWAGWLFISISSQLIVWPLAHLCRQLPFTKGIL